MSFAVDEFLVICSINCPSPSLRTIMEALADADPLSSPVNFGKLLRAVVAYSKHAKWALYYPDLISIPIDGQNIMGCNMRSVLRYGSEIASRFRHEEVTEMHLLLAILELQPADIAAALSLAVRQFKMAYPQGTPRRQTMLDFAIAQGRSDWIADTQRRIEETPYSVERIRESVLKYFSSRYYPYESQQWDEFRRDYPDYNNLSDVSTEIQGAYLRFLDNGLGIGTT